MDNRQRLGKITASSSVRKKRLVSSGKKSHTPVYHEKKVSIGGGGDRHIWIVIVVVIFFTIAIIITLIPSEKSQQIDKGKNWKNRNKTIEKKRDFPSTDQRPVRVLPEGKLGEWARSVVYIECGELNPFSHQLEVQKTGSGFVISEAGDILTNTHVIEGTSTVIVTFYDGSYSRVRVVKTDKVLDVALLNTELPANVGPLEKDLNLASIGRKILVMGFPLGSALGREMTLTDGLISSVRQGSYDKIWYQISAPVNLGNSGCPLLDAETGKVLGIVTAKILNAESIAFARPIGIVSKYFLAE